MLAYYVEARRAVEAAAGLTEEDWAHRPLESRGRPGHERTMTVSDLRARGVDFVIGGSSQGTEPDVPEVIRFDEVYATIISYRVPLMNRLRRYPEVRFVPFPEFIDQFLERIEEVPAAARSDYVDFFKRYYFDFNRDPIRWDRLSEAVPEADPSPGAPAATSSSSERGRASHR
jgi:hypothetical protein